MAKTKRILMNFTFVCVILLFSVLCSFFVCLNSDNKKQNLDIGKSPIEQQAEVESLANAENKYGTAVMNLAKYKMGVQKDSEQFICVDGKYYTCWVTDGSKSGDYGYYTIEDSYYTISTDQEFSDFVKLTYERSSDTYYLYHPGYGARFVTEHYVKYPFQATSLKVPRVTFKHGDTNYMCFLIPQDSEPTKGHQLYQVSNFLELPSYSPGSTINLTDEESKMKVLLKQDITVTFPSKGSEDETICYFAGVFDGEGHTIKFKGENDIFNYSYTQDVVGFDSSYSSFCKNLEEGAVIRNVKLDYSGMSGYLEINDSFLNNENSVAGGIVGCNKGLVENCIVDSPRVYSQRYNSNAYYGALVGRNEGTVQNCIVQGDYEVKAHRLSFLSNVTGINAYWGCVPTDTDGVKISKSNVQKCLFIANVTEVKSTFADQDKILSPADVGKTAGKNQFKYDSTVGASSCYDVFNGGNRKVDLKYTNLSPEAVGGSIEEAKTPWYFAPDYRDVPLLRPFMNWRSIYFKVANAAQGGVDPESIKVPSDANGDAVGKTRGSYITINILNQSITATPANQTLTVLKWEWNGSNTYTVYFSENFAYFEFKNKIEAPTRVDVVRGYLKFDQVYRVAFGTKIEVKVNPYVENHSSQAVIQSVEYIIDGVVYARSSLTEKWYQVGNKLILKAKSAYYMVEKLSGDTLPDSLENDSYALHQQINVSYSTYPKTYSVVIK